MKLLTTIGVLFCIFTCAISYNGIYRPPLCPGKTPGCDVRDGRYPCLDDCDCPLLEKCCRNLCGRRRCVPANILACPLVEPRDDCPKNKQPDQCLYDEDCTGTMICCKDACAQKVCKVGGTGLTSFILEDIIYQYIKHDDKVDFEREVRIKRNCGRTRERMAIHIFVFIVVFLLVCWVMTAIHNNASKVKSFFYKNILRRKTIPTSGPTKKGQRQGKDHIKKQANANASVMTMNNFNKDSCIRLPTGEAPPAYKSTESVRN